MEGNKLEIREHILAVLADNKNKIDFETLLAGAEEKPGTVREAVRELISEGKVMKSNKGKLFLPGSFGYFSGRLEVKRLGFAFLLDEDGDIFVSADNKAGAMNGDLVAVRMLSGKETNRKREGRVVEILGDEERRVVGLLSGKFIVPDDERMDDVYVPRKYMSGAKSGQKVVAAIIKRAAGERSPEGKIVEVLGDAGVNSVEIQSYIKRFELPEDFGADIENEAKAVSERKMNIKGRLDLRRQTVFTIDGVSAKDLDDAVSIKKVPKGYELGVHIADVAHYVLEGTKLDKEAQERGTSVYLADFVIPMLPKLLSNGICSLAQGKDRLTLSCIMTIDEDGRISHSKIVQSVIRSKHRMTYNDVNTSILTRRLTKSKRKISDTSEKFFTAFHLLQKLFFILFKLLLIRLFIAFAAPAIIASIAVLARSIAVRSIIVSSIIAASVIAASAISAFIIVAFIIVAFVIAVFVIAVFVTRFIFLVALSAALRFSLLFALLFALRSCSALGKLHIGKVKRFDIIAPIRQGNLNAHFFRNRVVVKHHAFAVWCFDRASLLWHTAFRLSVMLILIVETAHQPSAKPAYLGWRERQILLFGHLD